MHPSSPEASPTPMIIARAMLVLALIVAAVALIPRTYQTDWHEGITTTYENGGAPPQDGDMGIPNIPSAWYTDWAKHLCGVDHDGSRALDASGCDNLYYFALPCPDFDEDGQIVANIARSPWSVKSPDESAFKNKWIAVKYEDTTVYAQWADVGPLAPGADDDCDYVFGHDRPAQEAGIKAGVNKDKDPGNDVPFSGLDISPRAFMDLTGKSFAEIDDLGFIKANWRFVEADEVPDGPWKINVTTSGPDW